MTKRIQILKEIVVTEHWLFQEARRENPKLKYSDWVESGARKQAWRSSRESRRLNAEVKEWVHNGGIQRGCEMRRRKMLRELLDPQKHRRMLNEVTSAADHMHPEQRRFHLDDDVCSWRWMNEGTTSIN